MRFDNVWSRLINAEQAAALSKVSHEAILRKREEEEERRKTYLNENAPQYLNECLEKITESAREGRTRLHMYVRDEEMFELVRQPLIELGYRIEARVSRSSYVTIYWGEPHPEEMVEESDAPNARAWYYPNWAFQYAREVRLFVMFVVGIALGMFAGEL